MKTLSIQCRVPVVALAQLALEAESSGRAIRSKSTLVVHAALAYVGNLEPLDETTALGVLSRIFSDEVLAPKETLPKTQSIQSIIAQTMKDSFNANPSGE